jgi:hypothetical protein
MHKNNVLVHSLAKATECQAIFRRLACVPRVAALLLLTLLCACTTTIDRRAGGLSADAKIGAGKSVVILDADVALSELLLGGLQEPREAWSKSAQTHINAAIAQELSARSIRLTARIDPESLANAAQVKQLELLAESVGFSIVRFQLLPYGTLPTKKGSFDWTIGPNAQLLKKAYGADYALTTYVRDSYASGGRVAMALLLGASTGQRLGYTLLIDLNTGQVVWANLMASETGDLRTAEGAKKVVKSLLTGMPL